MSEPVTIECMIQFSRNANRRSIAGESASQLPKPGRIPRVTRLLALAHRFDGYLRDGVVKSQGELAILGHVSAVRIAQIMNLLNLATDIQETILFFEPTTTRGVVTIEDLQPIASTLDWNDQRQQWATLRTKRQS